MWKKIEEYLNRTLMLGFLATAFGVIPMFLMFLAFREPKVDEWDFLWVALKVTAYIQVYGMLLNIYIPFIAPLAKKKK